jgi:hypothetical protein
MSTDRPDLQPRHELPPFARPSGLETWNRFAAVNDEFVDIHMDDRAGRAAGYGGAFGMGNLQWAYLHNLLREWLPPDGRILELACEFRRASEGERVTARGRIESIERNERETTVRLSVWTESVEDHTLAIGRATVLIPS